jgi:4-aminobutyrate aminotransferase-like enzyme/acyl carrier protein
MTGWPTGKQGLTWSRSTHRSTLDESGILRINLTVLSASGATLRLMDENLDIRECIDLMSAYGSVNFGHRNPEIPVQSSSVDVVACIYPPEADILAEWLCTSLELPGHEVLYQVGGSFAVASAVAIAQRRHRGTVLSVAGAFHGLGIDSLGLTSVHRDLALQGTAWSGGAGLAVKQITPGTLPDNWDDISAVIFEPVQGANGYVPLPLPWLAELTESARRSGVTVIADEIQSGFYRHGSLSVARANGIEPDIVLFGKSLTNGRYPLSAVVYRSTLLPASTSGIWLAHTFQTGAEGFRAACAVAEYIDTHPVDKYSDATARTLSEAAARVTALGATDCYVSGPTLSFTVPGISAREIVNRCFERGVLPFTGGATGQRVRIAPPITIPTAQLEQALSVVLGVIQELSGKENMSTVPTSPQLTQDEFRDFLNEFLRTQSGEEPAPVVTDETDLFAAGILDSLRLIEFIVAAEKFVGGEIRVEDISVRSFRTPATIWAEVVAPVITGKLPDDLAESMGRRS